MFFRSQKGLSSVIVAALFLVLVVVAVIGFQSWYGFFSDNLFVELEEKSSSSGGVFIETVVDGELYLKLFDVENLSVSRVDVGGKRCLEDVNVSSLVGLDVSSCLENVSGGSFEVVVVSDSGVVSKFFSSDLEEGSMSLTGEISGLKLREYDFSNVCSGGGMNGFEGGDGSIESPFEICSCEQFSNVRDDLSANYVLVNDVDCSVSAGWNGGDGFLQFDDDFLGSFDGRGFVVSSVTSIEKSYYGDASIFKNLEGSLKNVGFVDVRNLSLGLSVEEGGLVDGVFFEGYGKIQFMFKGNYGFVKNVYSYGEFETGIFDFQSGVLEDSYSYVKVDYGGIANNLYTGNTARVFWDVLVSGSSNSAVGIGKVTSEMEGKELFVKSGWDENVWVLRDGEYPRFRWEFEEYENCFFDGIVVEDGGSLELYENYRVKEGDLCVNEERVCNGGVLSGSFEFEW